MPAASSIIAGIGVAVAAGGTAYSIDEGRKEKKKVETRNSQALKSAKDKAAELKEASAKRSTLFDDDTVNSQQSLLTAQKAKRRAVSGAAGTRLTGGKLGSPATAGGATLLGQ